MHPPGSSLDLQDFGYFERDLGSKAYFRILDQLVVYSSGYSVAFHAGHFHPETFAVLQNFDKRARLDVHLLLVTTIFAVKRRGDHVSSGKWCSKGPPDRPQRGGISAILL